MNITVYCGSNPGTNPRFAAAAHELGIWVAENSHVLVYGGSSVGLMGTLSHAALNAGGEVHGVEPGFFIEAGVAQHDLTELHIVDTMGERKAKMVELGDVFVALPGGVGTLEEISEIMSRIRLGFDPAECFLLNIDGFYNPLKALLDAMLGQGFLMQADLDRFHFPENVAELAHLIETAGERKPLRQATARELGPSAE